MSTIDLDFSGVSREGGGLLEEGSYILTIQDIELKPAKGEGKFPTIWASYETSDGKKIRDFLTLHPDVLWRVRIWLEAITGDEFDGPISFDAADLMGRTVGANVSVKPRYNDPTKETNEITSYYAA